MRTGNVLDRWILVRLNDLICDVSKKLDAYDITGAARVLEDFCIADFSQWYLRRSRRRLQHPRNVKEKDDAARISGYLLLILAALAAPFVPFLSEAIYRELKKKMKLREESVHLLPWPSLGPVMRRREDALLLARMETVRRAVGEGLKLRARAGIKVRQPLQELRIKNQELMGHADLLALIKDEVNVKEISFGDETKLDTRITPVLKGEGAAREIIRTIQEMRRDLSLRPRHVITIRLVGSTAHYALLSEWGKVIMAETGAKEICEGGKKIFRAERELEIDGGLLWIGVS